jgi:hypothetical protein
MNSSPMQTSSSGSLADRTDQVGLSGIGLTLALFAAGVGYRPAHVNPLIGTISSQTVAQVVVQIESHDLVQALGSLHDRLLSRTTELEPDAKAVLYSSLWDLYSE